MVRALASHHYLNAWNRLSLQEQDNFTNHIFIWNKLGHYRQQIQKIFITNELCLSLNF